MVRPEGDDKPVTRYDCEQCLKIGTLQTEVEGMKGWVASVDGRVKTTEGRMWAILILAIGNLLAALGAVLILLLQKGPAIAAAIK